MRVLTWSVLASGLLLLGLAMAPPLAAQDGGDATVPTNGRAYRLTPLREARALAPGLRRTIALNMTNVPILNAIRTIERLSGLAMLYSSDDFPKGKRVTLRADTLDVADALTRALDGTDVGVFVALNGQVVLAKQPIGLRKAPRAANGSIVGRVTDAKTGDALVGAELVLEGTKLRTASADKGAYRFMEVPAGTYTLSVRRIGYAKRNRSVTVIADQELTADVALDPVVTQLNELVTTVTGEQRMREVGHVIGRINADSLVKEAPVSSLSELLAGRVPGLQVYTQSGLVGGQVSLQIRTPNSISLGSEPILIVDGVRYANDLTGRNGPFPREATSRLNDLNPNDIESIEVVKGPSAATLYGTDASNGVIVISTKRGRPGPARWTGYAKSTIREMSLPKMPDTYWGWSDELGLDYSCTLQYQAEGYCLQDSITVVPNPLNDPDLTIFHNKPSWELGLGVSGGQPDVRYLFSADLVNAKGPVQMPVASIEKLKALRGVDELPEEQREPNTDDQATVRGNVTLAAGGSGELQFNSGYSRRSVRTLKVGENPYNVGSRLATPNSPYGFTSTGPESQFAQMSTEGTDRFFGSVAGRAQLAPWLQARGTLGLDLANSDRYSLQRRGEPANSPGQVGEDRTRRLGITGDAGVSSHLRLQRLGFRTSVGAQYTRQRTNVVVNGGVGLPPGGESVQQAQYVYVSQYYTEVATLGSYIEETVGLNDRLYLTGAVRIDGGSNFGRNYDAATYPKASASWIVSEEPFMPRVPGLDELRLRYAYGASGQQAMSYMTLPMYTTRSARVDGVTSTAVGAFWLGNVDLKPERVREHEFGFDATGLGGRVQVAATWFKRTTTDQILSRTISAGFGSIYRNLGRVDAHGFEAEVTLQPIVTPTIDWRVTLTHSLRRNDLNDLGGITSYRHYMGGYVEGYSLGARFSPKILGWNDANGDGLLVPSELQMTAEPVYQGESTPPRTQTLVTSIGLFQRRVRLSALFQRLSGYTQINGVGCISCRDAVDLNTPLEIQARLAAPFASSSYADIESADHTRLEELTLAIDLPSAVLRALRARSGSLALSGRNLALWSSFSGPDPASASVGQFYGNDASNIPESRSWVVRFDLGL